MLRLHGYFFSTPTKRPEEITAYVDKQLEFFASPDFQFYDRFEKEHTNQFVTVILLAHALSEALINAVLAIGLADAGATELFPLLERTEFKEKWLYAPKSFARDYKFPEGSALHETLVMLTRHRNALVHLKIDLTVDGSRVLKGTEFEREQYADERQWMRRYFSLPYDLAEFARKAAAPLAIMLLFDRKPIEVASVHALEGRA